MRTAHGPSDDLLVVKLDITNAADAEVAVQAALERFGRIDVLINNAASFQAGFFEEVSPEQFRAQYEFRLDLWTTANVFLPGHRIRLEVSSSNFPRLGRNSNTGGDIASEGASDYRLWRGPDGLRSAIPN